MTPVFMAAKPLMFTFGVVGLVVAGALLLGVDVLGVVTSFVQNAIADAVSPF
jgi:hypothetical protein